MPLNVDVESRKYRAAALGALAVCAIISALRFSPSALYVAPRTIATQHGAHRGTAPVVGRPHMRAPVPYSVTEARSERFVDEPGVQNLGSEPVSFEFMITSVAGLAGLVGLAVFAFRYSWKVEPHPATIALLATTATPSVTVVDTPETLEQCKEALKGVTVLALDCEGVDLNRLGSLTLVQLSTPSACFLIDMLDESKSGERVSFVRTVLEDRSITKIIHDCKCDSDSLFHEFDINLQGVHDTQVWHQVLLPEVKQLGLNGVLEAWGLPTTPRDGNIYNTNPSIWAERPLTDTLIARAAVDVQGLFDLYQKQLLKGSEQESRVVDLCKASSEANILKLRDGVAHIVHIKPSQTGLFIGRGGANIRGLENRYGVSFYGRGKRGAGACAMFAPAHVPGEQAVGASSLTGCVDLAKLCHRVDPSEYGKSFF